MLRGKAARLVRSGGATTGRYLLGLTGLLAAIGLAIPALLWLVSWLSWHAGSSPPSLRREASPSLSAISARWWARAAAKAIQAPRPVASPSERCGVPHTYMTWYYDY